MKTAWSMYAFIVKVDYFQTFHTVFVKDLPNTICKRYTFYKYKWKEKFVHVNAFISFSLLANVPLDSFSLISHLPPNQTLPILSPPLFASCNPPPLVSSFLLSHRRRTEIYVGSPAWSWWWLQSSSYAGRLSTSLSSSQPWSKSPAPHCWLLPGTSASPWATPTGSTWHYMGTKSPQNC